MEAKEVTISEILEAGKEIPLRSSHQQRECSVGWASCSAKGGTACQKSVSMQLFIEDNIDLDSFDGVLANKFQIIVAVSLDCFSVYSALLNYNNITAINSSTLSK